MNFKSKLKQGVLALLVLCSFTSSNAAGGFRAFCNEWVPRVGRTIQLGTVVGVPAYVAFRVKYEDDQSFREVEECLQENQKAHPDRLRREQEYIRDTLRRRGVPNSERLMIVPDEEFATLRANILYYDFTEVNALLHAKNLQEIYDTVLPFLLESLEVQDRDKVAELIKLLANHNRTLVDYENIILKKFLEIKDEIGFPLIPESLEVQDWDKVAEFISLLSNYNRTLVDYENEIQFILYHEGSHLIHNDSRKKLIMMGAGIPLTLVAGPALIRRGLRTIFPRKTAVKPIRFPILRGLGLIPLGFCQLGASFVLNKGYSKWREYRADIEAAHAANDPVVVRAGADFFKRDGEKKRDWLVRYMEKGFNQEIDWLLFWKKVLKGEMQLDWYFSFYLILHECKMGDKFCETLEKDAGDSYFLDLFERAHPNSLRRAKYLSRMADELETAQQLEAAHDNQSDDVDDVD